MLVELPTYTGAITAFDNAQAKRRVMEEALRREFGDTVAWPEPKGGLFLWASFHHDIDTDALPTRAVAHRVVYVAGSAFYIDGRRTNVARLAFSAPSHARIGEGTRRLAAAVGEERSAMKSAGASAAVSAGSEVP